jgi:Cu2+-exporting ATPase
LLEAKDFESITGKGVVGTVNGKKIAGNAKLIQNNRKLDDLTKIVAEQKLENSVLYFGRQSGFGLCNDNGCY